MGRDVDTVYRERVAAVEERIDRLLRDYRSSRVAAAIRSAFSLLTDRINALVGAVGYDNDSGDLNPVVKAAHGVFEAVYAASEKLRLTSLFIDPGNPRDDPALQGLEPAAPRTHRGLLRPLSVIISGQRANLADLLSVGKRGGMAAQIPTSRAYSIVDGLGSTGLPWHRDVDRLLKDILQ